MMIEEIGVWEKDPEIAVEVGKESHKTATENKLVCRRESLIVPSLRWVEILIDREKVGVEMIKQIPDL